MQDDVIFEIFGRQIHWYGALFAGGFVAAIVHWWFLRKKGKGPAMNPSDLSLWTMLCGVIGARANYVIANWQDFSGDLLSIFRIDQGGLIFYGGFIGGIIGIIALARFKKFNLWHLSDFVITALPLGHAMGRVGCYMHGCCHGIVTKSHWGRPFEVAGELAMCHPTQLYEASGNMTIYLILLVVYFKTRIVGLVTGLYFLLYAILRFSLEFVRGDERQMVMGITMAQGLCLIFMLTGIIMIVTFKRRGTTAADLTASSASPEKNKPSEKAT